MANRMMEHWDLYALLGVAEDATPEQIKKAHRASTSKVHSDRHGGHTSADELQKDLNDARDLLLNATDRAEYDRRRRARLDLLRGAGGPGAPPGRDSRTSFTDGEPESQPPQATDPLINGVDLSTTFVISEEEARVGTVRNTDVPRRQTCSFCGGTGRSIFDLGASACGHCAGSGRRVADQTIEVAIPANTKDGATVRVRGFGMPGTAGGRDGDLVATVQVKFAPSPHRAEPASPDRGRSSASRAGGSLSPYLTRKNLLVAGTVVATVLLLVVIGATVLGGDSEAQVSPTPTASVDTPEPTPTSSATDSQSPTPAVFTASEALALTSEQALSTLVAKAESDAAAVVDLVGSESWVPLLSSKCPSFEEVDLVDAEGQLGYPDGVLETYSGGLGPERVLAFHLALEERFPGVRLTTPEIASDSRPARADCGDTDPWLSLHLQPLATPEEAQMWCEDQNLPSGECAMFHFRADGSVEITFRSTD